MRQIKVDDDVHEKLKEIAERRQISINDLVRELLNIYLGGFSSERSIDKVITKEFVADTEKYCSKCKRKVEVGESVTWVKYIYSDGSARTLYYCFECANQSIAKLYRKKREMELIIKQLKNEADNLVNEISNLETVRDFYRIKSEVLMLWRQIRDRVLSNDQSLNDVFDKIVEICDRINSIESSIQMIHGFNTNRIDRKRRAAYKQINSNHL